MLHEACGLLQGPLTPTASLAAAVAELFTLADELNEEDKVEHYYKIIEHLNAAERKAVYAQLEVTASQSSLKEYKTDFVALAHDSPQSVIEAFKSGCDRRIASNPATGQ